MSKRLVCVLFAVAAHSMRPLVATQGAFFKGSYCASAFRAIALMNRWLVALRKLSWRQNPISYYYD